MNFKKYEDIKIFWKDKRNLLEKEEWNLEEIEDSDELFEDLDDEGEDEIFDEE